MGQFESRPETPDEWAGIPAEPLDRTDGTELAAATAEGLMVSLGGPIGSIVIPVVPVIAEGEQPAPTEPDADRA